MKTLVLTDIHGCFDEMMILINKVQPTDIIITGDLIDRGLKSYEVVKYCIENNVKVCLGNHEFMFIEAMLSDDNICFSDWWANGGDKVYAQTTEDQRVEMLKYFQTLPLFIKTELEYKELPIVISHTALNTLNYDVLDIVDNSYKCKLVMPIVWNRTQPTKRNSRKFFSVFGHTPVQHFKKDTAILNKKGINIDTGCAYGYSLSGLILETMEIVKQDKL